MGVAARAHPSFGMTTTHAIRDLFVRPVCKEQQYDNFKYVSYHTHISDAQFRFWNWNQFWNHSLSTAKREDNKISSIRPSVCPFVCMFVRALPAERLCVCNQSVFAVKLRGWGWSAFNFLLELELKKVLESDIWSWDPSTQKNCYYNRRTVWGVLSPTMTSTGGQSGPCRLGIRIEIRNVKFGIGIKGLESVDFLLESESEPEPDSDFWFFLQSESESRCTQNRASLTHILFQQNAISKHY